MTNLWISDGVEGYETKADEDLFDTTDEMLRDAAENYASTYDHNDEPGNIVARISINGRPTSEDRYFAFDETGEFEWNVSFSRYHTV